ncbi:Na+/H+ antiporter subunit G [Corynebacterium yudongzhengii]|uniref:Na+/H+ antiporter subunit G n=1 Tax=Corynebacterium yudongzhengii TaxID=2080740 RepID=A0A2U1T5E7_9CORY|nr:Na+/H+ antiporter subunit G [Corynebacterium yudongzhengii]AWB81070.1 Na+/H+ antiporter subunit G [Corynebacterium yudongzhengii]PWC01237.1 Na+/H+ antiporter subunit G [Corynebacterium yudongzhengii]
MTIIEIIVAALVVLAAFMTLSTVVAQWRAPDALTRTNLMGPLVCVAVPALVIAKLVWDWAHVGFDLNDTLRAVIAIAGVWVVASVGSYYLGRSIYGVTVVDNAGEQ